MELKIDFFFARTQILWFHEASVCKSVSQGRMGGCERVGATTTLHPRCQESSEGAPLRRSQPVLKRTPPLHLGLKFREETVAVAGPFVASGRGTKARVVGLPSSMASSTRPLGHPFKPGARHYHINPVAATPSDRLPLFPCSSSSERDLFVGHPWPPPLLPVHPTKPLHNAHNPLDEAL